MGIVIKGGFVFDPSQKIDGERMDIFIEEKIVEECKGKVINAKNFIVMPAGVDIHSHIAGSLENIARTFSPEYRGRKDPIKPIPEICNSYLKLGYTFINEPAVHMIKALHTVEEFKEIHSIDKSMLLLLGNDPYVIKLIENKEYALLETVIRFLLNFSGAYGVKAVNPGGVEAWKSGIFIDSIHDTVPGYDISPFEIIKGVERASSKLPHPLHLHMNNIGLPGNYETTLETLKSLKKAHISHIQFHSYGGDSWKNICSESYEIVKVLNRKKGITFDTGNVLFGNTITLTADSPWEYHLSKISKRKWINCDVEFSSGGGAVPYNYRRKSFVNSLQWSIGLELVLLSKKLDNISLTTDSPKCAPFLRYPEIIALLMSRDYRRSEIERLNKRYIKRALLEDMDRELSIYEISKITRYNPARAMGISKKGSLAVGCDGDVAIYEIKGEKPNDIIRGFSKVKYLIKGGEVVVKDGEIVSEGSSKLYRLHIEINEEDVKELKNGIENRYTISLENMKVAGGYAHG